MVVQPPAISAVLESAQSIKFLDIVIPRINARQSLLPASGRIALAGWK
jgi:hypothetical protein